VFLAAYIPVLVQPGTESDTDYSDSERYQQRVWERTVTEAEVDK
jgi:hypothetical protein